MRPTKRLPRFFQEEGIAMMLLKGYSMKDKIKILLPIEYYQPIGGIERFLNDLSIELVKEFDLVWVVEKIGDDFKVDYPLDVKIIEPKYPRLEIPTIIKTEKPQFVFINNSMFFNMIALLYSRFKKIPIIYFCHQLPGHINSKIVNYFLWTIRRIYFRFAHVVLVPSEAVKNEFLKRRFSKIALVLHPGVNPNQFHPINDEVKQKIRKKYDFNNRNSKIICWAGRFSAEKCPDMFIQAAKNDPNNTYLLVGFESASKWNRQLNIQKKVENINNIKLLTSIGPDAIHEIYQLSDVYVNTSKYETYGATIAEASACGITTISPNHSGAKEAGKEGYLYNYNQAELEETIKRALESSKINPNFTTNKSNSKIFANIIKKANN